MTWRHTTATCGSIFIAFGVSKETAVFIGIVLLFLIPVSLIIENMRQEIPKMNAEELDRIKRERES